MTRLADQQVQESYLMGQDRVGIMIQTVIQIRILDQLEEESKRHLPIKYAAKKIINRVIIHVSLFINEATAYG